MAEVGLQPGVKSTALSPPFLLLFTDFADLSLMGFHYVPFSWTSGHSSEISVFGDHTYRYTLNIYLAFKKKMKKFSPQIKKQNKTKIRTSD